MALPFQIVLDSTGFPMIELPGQNYAISWLPVTKIQFEHFMCDTNLFNYDWYHEILDKFTPRVSPGAIRLSDYWNVFMTGVMPAEAIRFANWMGREYRLPTAQEWKDILLQLARYAAQPENVDDIARFKDPSTGQSINERAALLCRRLEDVIASESNQLVATDGRRLCDQMMMRLGVVEYVYEDNQMNTFTGWGQPNRRFLGTAVNPIRDTKPVQLVNRVEGTRMKHFGFRLIRRLR